MKYKNIYASLIIALLVVWGCNDQWDDYYKDDSSAVGSNVLEALKANSDYSSFVTLLENYGIEDDMSSSKIYTVWAPTNSALSTYSSLIPGDSSDIKTFLLNHICYERITYDDNSDSVTLLMASGKHLVVNYSKRTIDAIVLSDTEDDVVSNGVVHSLDKPITLRSTIWEYIKDMDYEEIDFLNSLTYTGFDADSATATGIDAETGETVYDTVSGMVETNTYLKEIADLRSEDSTFTFYVIDDASFTSENNKFRKYYVKSTDTKTDSMSMLHVVSDLVQNETLNLSDLNGSQISAYGTIIPITSANVTSSYQASNGTVYFVNGFSLPVEDRIKEIFVEGEYPYPDTTNVNTQSIFKVPDEDGTIVTWARNYASNGYCITSPSSTYTLKYVDFYIDNAYTCKYDVYWVSVTETESEASDTSEVAQYMQRILPEWDEEEQEYVDDIVYTSDTIRPTYTDNVAEQYVGQFEVDTLNMSVSYEPMDDNYFYFDNCIHLRVEGVDGEDTPIYLDYFRLVPIIE